MVNAVNVTPRRWSNISVLYDNDVYSAIWGQYDGNEHFCLGVRWNGDKILKGYPNQGGYPLWYVEPGFLTESILLEILETLKKEHKSDKQLKNYIKNTQAALERFRSYT